MMYAGAGFLGHMDRTKTSWLPSYILTIPEITPGKRSLQSSGLKKTSVLQQDWFFIANDLPPMVIRSCFFVDLKLLF